MVSAGHRRCSAPHASLSRARSSTRVAGTRSTAPRALLGFETLPSRTAQQYAPRPQRSTFPRPRFSSTAGWPRSRRYQRREVAPHAREHRPPAGVVLRPHRSQGTRHQRDARHCARRRKAVLRDTGASAFRCAARQPNASSCATQQTTHPGGHGTCCIGAATIGCAESGVFLRPYWHVAVSHSRQGTAIQLRPSCWSSRRDGRAIDE